MKYEYWFANLKGITNARKRNIRQGMKSAQMLYYIEETELKRLQLGDKEREAILNSIQTWNLDAEYQTMVRQGIRLVTVCDGDYPKRLLELPSAPYALYVKGELPEETVLTVAIVGARECSPYGEAMAREFARALAEAKVQIVSGMARGVDGAAQWSALEAGGKSFGVLGCGVDVCYPRDQSNLYQRLCRQGGILSEYPPGTRPLPQHFPARNRIISGLADVVLVMEAKEKSGSLITADMALEQGRDVYALPGPVNSRLSQGCNYLIRQGAGILLSPEDLLEELGILATCEVKNESDKKILLETKENIVYSCLDLHPRNVDWMIGVTKMSVSELLDALMQLELKGFVREISKNYYVKVK